MSISDILSSAVADIRRYLDDDPNRMYGEPMFGRRISAVLSEMDALRSDLDRPQSEVRSEGLHNIGFLDVESAIRMRGLIQKAFEDVGGKMIGGGFGFGAADIDIEFDGSLFNIAIRQVEVGNGPRG